MNICLLHFQNKRNRNLSYLILIQQFQFSGGESMLNRLNGFFSIKTLAGAFNKDRALLGAFSGHCGTSRTFVGSSISSTSSSCGSGSEIIIYLAVSDSRILAKCYFWYSLIKFMFNRAGNFVLKIFSKFLHLDIDEP